MELPPNGGDLENAKLRIAQRFRSLEQHLFEQIDELANSGWPDKRLCVMARADFERAFLQLEKALRVGAPNEYAKQPFVTPAPASFQPKVDPAGNRVIGEENKIEWQDVNSPK